MVLDTSGEGLPRVVHWGAALGDEVADVVTASAPPVARAALDIPVALSLLPVRADGWRGRPAIRGDFEPAFRVSSIEPAIEAEDAGLQLRTELGLEHGLLRLRHSLRNGGDAGYRLDELACVLPIPEVATEVLDLTGRWCKERIPQRRPLHHGTWLREGRHGRTGHDATLLLVAGTPGFGFRSGEVWGIHLGWSGDHRHYAERNADGSAVLGASELATIVLQPGEE